MPKPIKWVMYIMVIMPQYYEVGRVEALRFLGVSYKALEDLGIMMPVVQLIANFKKPALYDDELTIRTIIKEMPGIKMKFYYEIYNDKNILINQGETILVFVHQQTMKTMSMSTMV